MFFRLPSIATAALLAVTLTACGGGGSGQSGQSGSSASAGNPVTVTMWTRAATQAQSQRLVDAYNASHKNQVKLTVIPTDN